MCENAQTSIFGKPRYLHLTSFKNRKISTKNSEKPEIGIPGKGGKPEFPVWKFLLSSVNPSFF